MARSPLAIFMRWRYCFASAVEVFNFFLIQMPAAFFCKIGLISNHSVLICNHPRLMTSESKGTFDQ